VDPLRHKLRLLLISWLEYLREQHNSIKFKDNPDLQEVFVEKCLQAYKFSPSDRSERYNQAEAEPYSVLIGRPFLSFAEAQVKSCFSSDNDALLPLGQYIQVYDQIVFLYHFWFSDWQRLVETFIKCL